MKLLITCVVSFLLGIILEGGLTEFYGYSIFFANNDIDDITQISIDSLNYKILEEYNNKDDTIFNSERLKVSFITTQNGLFLSPEQNLTNKEYKRLIETAIYIMKPLKLYPFISCGPSNNPNILEYSTFMLYFCQSINQLYDSSVFIPCWTLVIGILCYGIYSIYHLYKENNT